MRCTLIITHPPPTPESKEHKQQTPDTLPTSSSSSRWASIDALRKGEDEIEGRMDLLRILDAVLPSHPPRSVPFSLSPISEPCAHLRVTLLLTSHRHLLLLKSPSSPSPPSSTSPSPLFSLPSTHCDRGETLTFAVQRFARALLGLSHLQPCLIRVGWGGVEEAGAVETWWHAGVEGSRREGEEGAWEVEGGRDGQVWRSYERARWVPFEEVEAMYTAGQVSAEVRSACQLLAEAEPGSTIGVPAVHVQTDASHAPDSDT